MTDKEALQLEEGDRVEIAAPVSWKLGKRQWIPATVVEVSMRRSYMALVYVRVRPDVNPPQGTRNRRRELERYPEEVRHAPHLDGTTGNVFADWLEEHGESEAAKKLRAAFPTIGKEAGQRKQEESSHASL